MIQAKKNLYFKVISIFLCCLFLFQADVLAEVSFSSGDTLDTQFNKAKGDYDKAGYEKAAARLERLTAVYENIKNLDEVSKRKSGQTLLLLGACREKLNQVDKAREYYVRAKKRLENDFSIPNLKLNKLKIYTEVKKLKPVKVEVAKTKAVEESKIKEETVIQKEKEGAKKKKFPWLVVVVGVIAVGALAYLLTAKKAKKTLTVTVGEGISGNPVSGVYTYKKGKTVNYNYSLIGGYTDLVVLVDGRAANFSGSITMDMNHTLTVSASRLYSLTVNKGEGISGNPATGTYPYKENEIVNYNYTLQSGYKDLIVTLDGASVGVNGNITMNKAHTLSVSANKIGRITGVTVSFSVRFAATNLKTRHRVSVNSTPKVDAIFEFFTHYSNNFDNAVKVNRNFSVTGSTYTLSITQEAGPYNAGYYTSEVSNIWSTFYELTITNYTYTGGVDPGKPTLSEDWFYLSVAPWETDVTDDWYRIETKIININLSSSSASVIQKKEEDRKEGTKLLFKDK